MFKWVKEILSYGSGKLSEEYHPEHLVAKLPDISEPVISFVETVRKYPKRFDVDYDINCVIYRSEWELKRHTGYTIKDKMLNRGWIIKGEMYRNLNLVYPRHIVFEYEPTFFLTPDEKEFLIKEISSIMNYRIERKAKLDKIRADRRIRDTRNKLKELYK